MPPVRTLADRVLREQAPTKLADATEGIAGEAMREIEASLPAALAGERSQLRFYVNSYWRLASAILDEIKMAQPDLVVSRPDGSEFIVELKHSRNSPEDHDCQFRYYTNLVTTTFTVEVVSAPFSDWVAELGAGRGTAVALIEQLRRGVLDAAPLRAPRKRRLLDWGVDQLHIEHFHRAVLDELSGKCSPLEHVATVFELNQTELARLFGVRRQAIEQWQQRGVPGERQEKLATLGEIADLLAAKLKPERIPGVVRRQADAYDGRSILQALAEDDQDLVLEELRDAFDWAAAA